MGLKSNIFVLEWGDIEIKLLLLSSVRNNILTYLFFMWIVYFLIITVIGGFWAWHRGECAETFEEKQVEETVHAVDYISPRS